MSYNFGALTTRYLRSSSPNINAYPSTLSAWVNLTDVSNVSQVLSWNIWISSTNLSMTRMVVFFNKARTATLYNSATVNASDTTTNLSANTWHHICIVLSNSSSRTVYLDNGGSSTNTTSLAISGMNDITIGVAINASAGAVSNSTRGRVSDVALWSTELNTDEIRSLSKGFSAKRIRPQSLEYYAPLTRDLIEYSGGLAITNNGSTPVADNQRIYL